MTLSLKKPLSTAWCDFACSVVNTAGVLNDTVATNIEMALACVPRDLFVEPTYSLRAQEDCAFPVGFDKITPKPSHIARMLGVIELTKGMRILEIGCSSGYCSAIMAAAGAQVFAIESVGLLAQKTRKLLDATGFQNVIIKSGNILKGWSEHAPFDAIIASTPIKAVPADLISQLSPDGGRLVAAIGDSNNQVLTIKQLKGSEVSNLHLEKISLLSE